MYRFKTSNFNFSKIPKPIFLNKNPILFSTKFFNFNNFNLKSSLYSCKYILYFIYHLLISFKAYANAENPLKFPTNCESDLRRIITKNYWYADKTSFIPKIENSAKAVCYFRPKRFGKSLFVSTLSYFYYFKEKENF